MSRLHRKRGLTLLEVLVTLMLLTTTLVAFAAVYPAAFKLNRKSQRSVQAAEIAGAVAEELRVLPFNKPNSTTTGGLFLEDFVISGWVRSNPRYARFPRTPIPDPYTLVSTTGQLGVSVTGDSPLTYADIIVTIFWQEPVNNKMMEKSVAIRTARTGNR